MQSLEGVINDMYVQFQVMAKFKSQENKGIVLPSDSFVQITSLHTATLMSVRYHIEIIHCDLPHTSLGTCHLLWQWGKRNFPKFDFNIAPSFAPGVQIMTLLFSRIFLTSNYENPKIFHKFLPKNFFSWCNNCPQTYYNTYNTEIVNFFWNHT